MEQNNDKVKSRFIIDDMGSSGAGDAHYFPIIPTDPLPYTAVMSTIGKAEIVWFSVEVEAGYLYIKMKECMDLRVAAYSETGTLYNSPSNSYGEPVAGVGSADFRVPTGKVLLAVYPRGQLAHANFDIGPYVRNQQAIDERHNVRSLVEITISNTADKVKPRREPGPFRDLLEAPTISWTGIPPNGLPLSDAVTDGSGYWRLVSGTLAVVSDSSDELDGILYIPTRNAYFSNTREADAVIEYVLDQSAFAGVLGIIGFTVKEEIDGDYLTNPSVGPSFKPKIKVELIGDDDKVLAFAEGGFGLRAGGADLASLALIDYSTSTVGAPGNNGMDHYDSGGSLTPGDRGAYQAQYARAVVLGMTKDKEIYVGTHHPDYIKRDGTYLIDGRTGGSNNGWGEEFFPHRGYRLLGRLPRHSYARRFRVTVQRDMGMQYAEFRIPGALGLSPPTYWANKIFVSEDEGEGSGGGGRARQLVGDWRWFVPS